MFTWLHFFGPEARQNIKVVGTCGSGDGSALGARKGGREREREREIRGKISPSKAYSQ
jgi:hypothetical protein